ncbi:helix-turn-helix transcriptional regulator [Embleya sp. NPDC001921]
MILTSFVGREWELRELRSLVCGDRRLLTLVGPGGIGKTRLALRMAVHCAEQAPADVVFVDLGALAHENLVDAAVLEATVPGVNPGQTPLRTAIFHLRERTALVVLDTCEHLPAAASRVARTLIEECPGVHVVATSRVPLLTPGERVWRVPPLAVGDGESARPSDAARLFVDRVALVRGDLEFSAAMWADVEHIAQALDGFPLAIELAAARVRMMTLGEIASALDLRILSGGPTRGQARHQTMRRSLDWSYTLLSEQEKCLFARLSVFVEGWTAEAVQAVCVDGHLSADQVLDTLTALVDKSLVVRSAPPSGDRYRMLLPMRQYGADLLAAKPVPSPPAESTAASTAARHLAYFVRFAEHADARLWALRPRERHLLDAEMPNLRAALAEACRRGSTDALRITAALGSYWRTRGSLDEGIEATRRALAAAPRTAHPARAMTLAVQATLTFWVGDLATAHAAAIEAIEIADLIGDKRARSHALLRLANATAITDPQLGQPMLHEAVELARECDDIPALADALGSLAMSLLWQDEFELMTRTAEEALAVAESIDFNSVRSLTAWCLAHGARATGEVDEAIRLARTMMPSEDESSFAENNSEAGAFTRSCQAQVLSLAAAMQGDPDRALSLARAERERLEKEPMRWGSGLIEHALAFAELAAGNLDAARRIDAREGASSAHLVLHARSTLMLAALAAGDPPAAREHAADIVRIADRIHNRRAHTVAALGEARATLIETDTARAELGALQALTTSVENCWWLEAITALEIIAAAAADRGEHARATRLFAAVDAARRARGIVRVPTEAIYWESRRATATAGLDDAERARALSEGMSMSLSDAAEFARKSRNRRARASRGWESLTATETRVALLAADGLLNPEIAEQLFISRSTVKVHLSHIFTKLSVANRTELAVYIHTRRQKA